MMPENHSLSPDALRLLYAVSLYTGGSNRPWLKDFSISVIVHLGVREGLFETYDLAPSLINFRGIKMFARISQEAAVEMDFLFRLDLVERILLNTRYYAPTTATRISPYGMEVLNASDSISERDRHTLDNILRCGKCGHLLDFAVGRETHPVTRLVVSAVCPCISEGGHRRNDFWRCAVPSRERLIEEFFSIGNVAYKGQPFFLGGNQHE